MSTHHTPTARLQINGQAFGSQTQSRIISIRLTDKRGFEADELTIELDDSDQSLAFPPEESKIKVWLGYQESGLIYKGEYRITEITWQGPPDTLHITAQAADMSSKLAEQQEKSWHRTSLKAIVETIAAQHKLSPLVGKNYQNENIDHIDQTNESDAAFLTRLAEQYDAVATVKDGRLLFISAGEATTAGGTPLPEITLSRQSTNQYHHRRSAVQNPQAVRAYYTDKKTGKKQEIIISKDNVRPIKTTQTKTQKNRRTQKTVKTTPPVKTDGLKIKTLRHLYPNKGSAEHGARAAFKRLKRSSAEFEIHLHPGRPEITPESPIVLQGFKAEIDAEQWIGVEIETTLDQNGLSSKIKLESRLNLNPPQTP